jgi:molecular chaperone DnaK (HSP70)
MGFYNGLTKKLIDYKTNYPVTGSQRLQTLVDDQQILRIDIYEGESLLARRCKHICQVHIAKLSNNDLPKRNRRKLDLLIELDQNGYLNVNVIDILAKQYLNAKIDYNPVALNAFERSPYEKIVFIDEWISSVTLISELQLGKYIEQLDKLFEIMLKYAFEMNASNCCGSMKSIEKEIYSRVLLSKKCISKNRLCASIDYYEHLADELIEFMRGLSYKNKEFNLEHIFDNNSNKISSSCAVM